MRMAKISRAIEYKDIAGGEMAATNDSQGIVEGYLARIGNIDQVGDKIMPNAFAVTIKDSYARKAAQDLAYLWPFLFSHNWETALPPGGIFYAEEDRKGLYIKVQMNRDIQLGRELYSSFQRGTVQKLSVGYRAIRSDWEKIEGKSIRLLREMAVLEGSAVTFPANDLATVTAVKSGGSSMNMLARTKDFSSRYATETLDDWQFSDWGDLTTALKLAVMDCFATGSDPASTLETNVIPQFADALRQYVSEGAALGFTGDSGMGMDMGMMSMSGAGYDQKSGYLSVSGHTKIKDSVLNIMKHSKIIQSELSALESARSRQRANDLQGYPVYSGSSDRSIFEEKQDEQDAQEMIGLLAGSLEVQNSLRELKGLREANAPDNPLVSGVEQALANYLAATESKRRT